MSSVRIEPKLYKASPLNVLSEDISYQVKSGSVTYDADRSTKFNLTVELNTAVKVQPFKDYLAPFLKVTFLDTGYVIDKQIGLFQAVPSVETYAPRSNTARVAGFDLTYRLFRETFPTGHNVSQGTNVVSAVIAIINDMGFTGRVLIQGTTRTQQYTRSWPAGTPKLTVCNDLLQSIGYYTLYMTRDGRFMSRPYRPSSSASVSVDYSSTSEVPIVRTITHNADNQNIINQAVVVMDRANQDPLVGVRTNSNIHSPTSVPRLGATLSKTFKVSDINSQDDAEMLAQQFLDSGTDIYQKLTLYTMPDPRRVAHEVYRLDVRDSNNQQITSGLWRCRGWTIGFTPDDGPMRHELSNVDNPAGG